jgi:sterol desaturase/sphingolipid hydroxylase (fatty acid hydroxylase superfamily)
VRARKSKELPGWLTGAIIGGVGICLAALEFSYALRKPNREPRLIHTTRNLVLAAGAALVMQSLEKPFSMWLAARVERNELGVVPALVKSRVARTVLGVILLDYGLYLWHVLTHKVPLLWRFHAVHHIDLDLDASTAIRFHFGEMLLSVPWRLAQIRAAGASPLAVSIWQTFLLASILFHHSNVRLPRRLERRLSFLIMTPRLHGTHHEARRDHANSNWSSGLTIWDLLHGTYQWRDAQGMIGVPAFQEAEAVTLPRCVLLPFERQPDSWDQLPEIK